MYGMIHKAARDMAIERLGVEAWDDLVGGCGLTGQHFITAEYFDDAISMSLIDAVAARMDVDRDAALEAFGRHWIKYAGASAYARLMAMAGGDIETFVENLDRMHASIKSTMPQARMPHFSLLGSDQDEVAILYQSERSGLNAFVQGILAAVAERFGERVAIRQRPREDGVVFVLARRDDNAERPRAKAR
jgi:hypothetical protein